MKNADAPAMPFVLMDSGLCGVPEPREVYSGFTKREKMAIEFTKANIIGIHSITGAEGFHNWSNDDFAQEGLKQADALLAALEEKESK